MFGFGLSRFSYSFGNINYLFAPVAIETLGAVGSHSLSLLKDIGRRIASESGELGQIGGIPHPASVSGSPEGECHVSAGERGHVTELFIFCFISFHHDHSLISV